MKQSEYATSVSNRTSNDRPPDRASSKASVCVQYWPDWHPEEGCSVMGSETLQKRAPPSTHALLFADESVQVSLSELGRQGVPHITNVEDLNPFFVTTGATH